MRVIMIIEDYGDNSHGFFGDMGLCTVCGNPEGQCAECWFAEPLQEVSIPDVQSPKPRPTQEETIWATYTRVCELLVEQRGKQGHEFFTLPPPPDIPKIKIVANCIAFVIWLCILGGMYGVIKFLMWLVG